MAESYSTSTPSSSGGNRTVWTIVGVVMVVLGVLLHGQSESNAGLRSVLQPEMFAGLGLDFAKVLTNVGLFLVFIQIIASFFWAPLAEAIDGRNEELERTFSDADEMRSRMQTMKTDYEARLAAVEASAREHIEAQIKEAQNLRQTLMSEAATRADAMIDRAQQEIASERERILGGLRDQVVELSLVAAEKIIGENMDTERNRKLVDEFVGNLEVAR